MIEHSEWAIDEPDQQDEACGATYRSTSGGETFKWEDYDCDEPLNYVCQDSKYMERLPSGKYCKKRGWDRGQR